MLLKHLLKVSKLLINKQIYKYNIHSDNFIEFFR